MKLVNVVLGILTVLLGGFCLFRPGIAFASAAWMLGLLLIFAGVNNIIFQVQAEKKSGLGILKAVVLTIVGLLLFFNNFVALFTDSIILYMICFGFVVSGILQIVRAVSDKKNGSSSWGWLLAGGILLIVGGLFAIAHPILTAISAGYCMAFAILCDGIGMIMQAADGGEAA